MFKILHLAESGEIVYINPNKVLAIFRHVWTNVDDLKDKKWVTAVKMDGSTFNVKETPGEVHNILTS